MTIDDGTAYGEPFSTAIGRACASRATACASTPSRSPRAAAASPAPPTSAGTAPTRSTPKAAAWRSRRSNSPPSRTCRRSPACSSSPPAAAPRSTEPRYDVRVGVQDLFFGDEGIGEVTGRLSVRDELLTYELEAASPRLAVSGTGRIALDDARRRRAVVPRHRHVARSVRARVQADFSPYTTAMASGTIRVVGELYNRDALRDRRRRSSSSTCGWSTTACAIRVRFSCASRDRRCGSTALRLVGDDTALDLTGSVDLPRQALSLQANGAANLAVLQGFMRDIRSSGRADVSALIGGTVDAADRVGPGAADRGAPAPLLVSARARGPERRRHVQRLGHPARRSGFTTPLNGRLGGGPVKFAGRIGIDRLRAVASSTSPPPATDMRLRFPEGHALGRRRDAGAAGPGRRRRC